MNAFFIFILTLFSAGEKTADQASQEHQKMSTYYFIRHAEKETGNPSNRDPKLSEAGEVRAQKWAEILEEVKFDLIYTSDFDRTRATAKAVAETQQKPVEIYDPKRLNDSEFQKKTKGKTVLVVGHSNTNPGFVNSLLGEKRYENLDEDNYGCLFIVHIAPDGTKSSEVLNFN